MHNIAVKPDGRGGGWQGGWSPSEDYCALQVTAIIHKWKNTSIHRCVEPFRGTADDGGGQGQGKRYGAACRLFRAFRGARGQDLPQDRPLQPLWRHAHVKLFCFESVWHLSLRSHPRKLTTGMRLDFDLVQSGADVAERLLSRSRDIVT